MSNEDLKLELIRALSKANLDKAAIAQYCSGIEVTRQ